MHNQTSAPAIPSFKMSPKQLKVVSLTIVLVALLSSQSSGQQPSCVPPMVSLSPCISYMIGNSSMPSSLCCSVIATIIERQTPCLCSMLNGRVNQLGFIVNVTQAITGLPGACSIPGPSTGQCSGVFLLSPTAVSPSPSSSTSLPNAVSPALSTKTPSQPTTPLKPLAPSGDYPTMPSISATGSGSKTKAKLSSASGSMKMAPTLLLFHCSLLWVIPTLSSI